MSDIQLDFPLILVVLVFGSGLIWLLDSLVLARGRQRTVTNLREQLPGWQETETAEGLEYSKRIREEAAEPLVVEYSKSFFPVLFVVFVLRSFLVEPFQIPSSSMVPTLQVGDYILVNKYTFGVRLPVLRTKVLDLNKPERGDVMVFFPPHMNDTYFIKRVIGLPGDTISYQNKQIFVNGQRLARQPLAEIPGVKERYRLAIERVGDDSHLIQTDPRRGGRDFSIVVRPGHYFMMGDNRDNSSDSRVWGQVPEQDIVGKAFAIWMHWDSFLSIPSFKRVGLIE